MQVKRIHSCHKLLVGAQRKKGRCIYLFFFFSFCFKSTVNLACHHEKETTKAGFSVEVTRNNSSQYSMGVSQVDSLQEMTPICTLAALLREMLESPSVIPHCWEWSVCSTRVLRPQIFLGPALPALYLREQDLHIPGDVLLQGHAGLWVPAWESVGYSEAGQKLSQLSFILKENQAH